MSELAEKKCVPCTHDVPQLNTPQLRILHEQLGDGWRLVHNHHLTKSYRFRNFVQALDFVNKVGNLAEEQGHHPDVYLAWGRVRLDIWTHKIDGLTESDFIFAAKADRLLAQVSQPDFG